MKKTFSTKWKSSKQPRKQRKYLFNIPVSIRKKIMISNLNKELRKKYGRRNFQLTKGDSVKIMVGEFRGKNGKVEIVNRKKGRVTISGINHTKKDGTKVGVYFKPSNLQIRELNLEDKKRISALNRKNSEKNKETKFKKLPKSESKNAPEKK
jgi:large subunit ribosomal protein L24